MHGWAWALVLILLIAALVAVVIAACCGCFSSCKRRCKSKRKSEVSDCRCGGVICAGVNPASMAVTRDGRIAYVANNNNYNVTGGNTVSVLDLRQNLLASTISDPSFDEPYRIVLYKGQAFVANSGGTTLTIVDTETNAVTGVIGGFDGPSGFALVRRLKRLYVNNYGSSAGVGSGNGTTLSVVDLTTNTIVGPPITVGLAPAALAASKDGNFVYVVNYVDGNPGTGTLAVVSTATNLVVNTVNGFSGPFGIAVSQKKAVVTNFGSNNFDPIGKTVAIIDLDTLTIEAELEVGIQPAGVAIRKDGKKAYVSNYNTLYSKPGFNGLTAGQGTVNIIDLTRNRVVGPTIAVGNSPNSVTIDPCRCRAFTTNYTNNSVSIFPI
jgi:DNA-binding beta-propeller fold protein YncE